MTRTSQGMPGCALLVLAVAVAAVVHGCWPTPPACEPDSQLAKDTAAAGIEAHVVIASHVCDSYAHVEDCPQLKPILEDAAARRERWVQCH